MVGILKAAVIAVLLSTTVYAKSILVSGTVEVISPKINAIDTGAQQAYVKKFLLHATEASGSGCRLTGDINMAMADHGDQLVCLFEWTELPNGLNAVGMGINGQLNEIGNLPLSYSISYFSGSDLQKVHIKSGSLSVEAVAPIMPVLIKGVTTMSKGDSFDTMDFTSHDRASKFKTFTVTSEPRAYNQVFKVEGLDGGSSNCIVETGQTSCQMEITWLKDIDVGLTEGVVTAVISMDSENGYFSSLDSDPISTLYARRDFRAPVRKRYGCRQLERPMV